VRVTATVLGALALSSLVVALWVLGGSLHTGARFPVGNLDRALLRRVPRVMVEPIAAALSQRVERTVRDRAECLCMGPRLSLAETMALFLDERVDLARRRGYAYRLARVGSPAALAALRQVLRAAPLEHAALLAQLIGSAGNPAAKPLLLALLEDGDDAVVLGAIRGLAVLGGDMSTASASSAPCG
jgi:HEAT repeat protein